MPGRRLRLAARLVRRLASSPVPVEPEVAALDDFLGEGHICCDIGAEYGLYTLTFASRAGRTGRVLAFEPLPGPRRFLIRMLRWLGAANVTVRPHALGDEVRQGTMSLPTRRGLPVHGRAFLTDDADGLGPNAEFAGDRRLRVDVFTLDSVVDEAGLDRIDVIKIDVEGYEPAVLRGAEQTIRRFRPILLIEIEDRHLGKFGADGATVVDLMTRLGYRMSTLWDGRWEPVETVTERTRNYLFTPS
ncbi:MAG TPA: FkbM family methyltransferase [Egicoccus sp.]|nr:FkbM family methyltransferase [Egicoccus sp.]HSK24193.1 FkbM family methyltransferase [Egicoccus sp.]